MDTPGERLDAGFSGEVAVFSAYLRETAQPFLLLGEPGGQEVHVRFTGPFAGNEVVWDCRFVTFHAEYGCVPPPVIRGAVKAQRCFIEISQAEKSGVPVRVCLDLPRIDLASIRKMIIMLRNFKRLRWGRHEFGDRHLDLNPEP